jgi:hypothetical protein
MTFLSLKNSGSTRLVRVDDLAGVFAAPGTACKLALESLKKTMPANFVSVSSSTGSGSGSSHAPPPAVTLDELKTMVATLREGGTVDNSRVGPVDVTVHPSTAIEDWIYHGCARHRAKACKVCTDTVPHFKVGVTLGDTMVRAMAFDDAASVLTGTSAKGFATAHEKDDHAALRAAHSHVSTRAHDITVTVSTKMYKDKHTVSVIIVACRATAVDA